MDTQRGERNSSSQDWQRPWQDLMGFVSAVKFWRDLRSSSFGLDSLHGLYSTSMTNLFRCRAVIYLLLTPPHKCNTVPALVKYLRALDPVLADPKAPLGTGSWFDLDKSFDAAVQAQRTPSSGQHFNASQHATPASYSHVYTGQQPVPSAYPASTTPAYRTQTHQHALPVPNTYSSSAAQPPQHHTTTTYPTAFQQQVYTPSNTRSIPPNSLPQLPPWTVWLAMRTRKAKARRVRVKVQKKKMQKKMTTTWVLAAAGV
jgi:hypothetical protein